MTEIPSTEQIVPAVEIAICLDENVAAVLPLGYRLVEASSFRTSPWARSARIRVQLPGGSQKAYFLKVGRAVFGLLYFAIEYIMSSFISNLYSTIEYKFTNSVYNFDRYASNLPQVIISSRSSSV